MFKRVFTTVVFLLLISITPVAAQSDYNYSIPPDEYAAYEQAVENCDSPSLECLVKNTTRFVAMEWVLDIQGTKKGKGTTTPSTDAGGVSNLAGAGIVGNMTKLIAGMYAYPPARTKRFVADVVKSSGVQPAYAQGLGFAALDPVLDLWKKFRNVSYFFFILIFIVIGFMIMFRQKIGGQAAITAQQAIPSIIISLILVTFSYAISGFLIDLMYLSMYMIIGLFGEITKSSGAATNLISMNIFQLGGALLGTIEDGLGDTTTLVKMLLTAMSGIESNAVTGLISIISGLTLSLVLAVAIVIAVFRLFFELLKSYASIVVGVVTAPIVLMLGAIPGNNAFGGWIKSMVGNLAAFPAVLLVTVLFYEFTNASSGAGSVVKSGGFMPPFLIGNGTSGIAGPLLGFALLLALPEVVKKIKEALGAKAGIGEQIAGWAGGRLKESVRYSPLIAGVPGYAYGLGEGVVKGAVHGDFRTSPIQATKNAFGWAGLRATQAADIGGRFAKGVEQVSEAKALDPNAWENVLLQQGRQAKIEKLKKRKEALEEINDPDPVS